MTAAKWLEKRRALREAIVDLAIAAEQSRANTPRIALAAMIRKFQDHEQRRPQGTRVVSVVAERDAYRRAYDRLRQRMSRKVVRFAEEADAIVRGVRC